MKKLILVLALVAAPLFAEPEKPAAPAADTAPAPSPSAEYQKAASILIAQRNAVATQLLDTQAQLQLALGEIESLKKQLADAQAKLAAATKPKDAEKTAAAETPPQPERKS